MHISSFTMVTSQLKRLVGLAFGTFIFNPNSGLSLLAISYQDGDLAVYDAWSRRMIAVAEANALSLASSPDGRTLTAGDSTQLAQYSELHFSSLHFKHTSYIELCN